jgi:hypothetical protein
MNHLLLKIMSYIEDVRALLRKKSTTYPDLLNTLISLQREHAVRITKLNMGLRNDIEELTEEVKTLQQILKISNRLQQKLEKKLNE